MCEIEVSRDTLDTIDLYKPKNMSYDLFFWCVIYLDNAAEILNEMKFRELTKQREG